MDWFLVAAKFSWMSLDSWWAIISMAFGLGMVIFVHELGHFLVAKWNGVKCEKFYIGFDVPISIGPLKLPPALAKWTWGETEYGIGIIPLGGYVKMLGQDDNAFNAEAEAERIRVPTEAELTRDDGTKVMAHGTGKNWVLDPRSYPAKSVPSRMAIISAGVIMNLITGAIFAMVAYHIGVPYTPCEVGDVLPGGPAWKAGLQPGDRILQIGRKGEPSEKLRYDNDLSQSVLIAGTTRDLPLLIRRGDGQEQWVSIRPVAAQIGRKNFARLWINSASSLKVDDDRPFLDFDPNQTSHSGLLPNDRIVAVEGKEVKDFYEFRQLLARSADKALTVTVERSLGNSPSGPGSSTVRADVTLQPDYVRSVGLVMRSGPIFAVRPGSVAERAGLREGDVIAAINGESLGDPLTVDERLRPFIGQSITLTVTNSAGTASREVSLVPEESRIFATGIQYAGINLLGLAIPVYSEVESLVPGGPADRAGVKVGDRLTEVQLVVDKASPPADSKAKDGFVISVDADAPNWAMIHRDLQWLPKGMLARCVFQRGSEQFEASLSPVDTGDYSFERKIIFTQLKDVNRSSSLYEAFVLGIRELGEASTKVVLFLHRLITGEISPTNIGGPGTIAVVATAEASGGISRLLIFLTLLSANLAVMNFLPIPVLDGGHMMFLTAEWIRGRPVDEKWQVRLTVVGLVFVLGLMFFAISNDVGTFTGWWG